MPFVSYAHTARMNTNIFSLHHRKTLLIVLYETYRKFNARGEFIVDNISELTREGQIYSETCFEELINAYFVEDVIGDIYRMIKVDIYVFFSAFWTNIVYKHRKNIRRTIEKLVKI